MKRFGFFLMLCVCTFSLWAQDAAVRGVIKDAVSGNPLVGVRLTLANQNMSTTSDESGEFSMSYLQAMDEEMVLALDGYSLNVKMIQLRKAETVDLGVLKLAPSVQAEIQDEVVLQLTDTELDSDDGGSQGMSTVLASRGDAYSAHISYAFFPVRFRVRGYDQKFETTYINGVNFNSQDRGMFNYSMLGGLNEITRNKDVVGGIESNSFGYSGIGTTTNIVNKPSTFAAGWKVSAAYSNRSYNARATATYATGIMQNGWSFAASAVVRYAKEGIVDGTFYNSAGYFFGAEKQIGDDQSISLVTFGAPTRRGSMAATTQETYNLAQSIYYNPYWGYQDGEKRNSRVVESYAPTAILNYEWKIDERQNLKAGLGFMYSLYSNSALTFYNAPDPRPDYYRNMPSFLFDGQIKEDGNFITSDMNGVSLGDVINSNGTNLGPTVAQAGSYQDLVELWANKDPNETQLNWDRMYGANYRNNIDDPNGSAHYMLERRHNDLMETALNAVYTNQYNDRLKMMAGVDLKYARGMYYKTVDDLLGGNQWIDVDPFSERDLKDLAINIGLPESEIANVKQNDLRNPDAKVTEGDVFGYNYHISMMKAVAFAMNEWKFDHIDFYYGLEGAFNSFQRIGYMENGRADYLANIRGNANPEYAQTWKDIYRSYGAGYNNWFIDPSVKAGLVYKINSRNRVKVNALAETNAPLARDSYISQRNHSRTVDNLTSSKLLSYDLTYEFNHPIVRGRVTGFRTHILDETDLNGYYDDEYRTFINTIMTGVDRLHQGIEAAVAVKMGQYFTLSLAATVSDNHYTSNANSVVSAENGMALAEDNNGNPMFEVEDMVLLENIKVATGPQLAGSVKLSFFHPKMWFADITASYFDWSYLEVAPSHRMSGLFEEYNFQRPDGSEVTGYTTELQRQVLGSQESLVSPNVWDRFLVDLSVGKMIYLPHNQALSINLSVSNLLNNTNMKTGGYQQGRLPRSSKQGVVDKYGRQESMISNNVWKYPAKYYYAWGANLFLNVSYRF